MSAECEKDLRQTALRVLPNLDVHLKLYLLESDWHTLRVRHLITCYDDALFCVGRRLHMLQFLKRRSLYYTAAARYRLGLARLKLIGKRFRSKLRKWYMRRE